MLKSALYIQKSWRMRQAILQFRLIVRQKIKKVQKLTKATIILKDPFKNKQISSYEVSVFLNREFRLLLYVAKNLQTKRVSKFE